MAKASRNGFAQWRHDREKFGCLFTHPTRPSAAPELNWFAPSELHYNWFIPTHPTASALRCQGSMKRPSEHAVMGMAELPAQLCWIQILGEERSQWWNQSFSLWGSQQSSEWKSFSAHSGFWIRPLFRCLVQEFGRVAWPPLLWMWFSSNSSIKWSSRTSLQPQMTAQTVLPKAMLSKCPSAQSCCCLSPSTSLTSGTGATSMNASELS